MMRIVLIGGGGHASDVLGVIEDCNAAGGLDGDRIEVAGILDDGEVDLTRFAGRRVGQIGRLADLSTIDATHHLVAAGWPTSRRAIVDQLGSTPTIAATIVHPTATIGAGVTVGEGVVVMAGVHLSPMASVGHHACLSNHAVVGHDAVVSPFAGLMPASVISGNTVIGEGAIIGANATVIEGIAVGAWATLGAGSVALADIPEGVVAVGVPARYQPR